MRTLFSLALLIVAAIPAFAQTDAPSQTDAREVRQMVGKWVRALDNIPLGIGWDRLKALRPGISLDHLDVFPEEQKADPNLSLPLNELLANQPQQLDILALAQYFFRAKKLEKTTLMVSLPSVDMTQGREMLLEICKQVLGPQPDVLVLTVHPWISPPDIEQKELWYVWECGEKTAVLTYPMASKEERAHHTPDAVGSGLNLVFTGESAEDFIPEKGKADRDAAAVAEALAIVSTPPEPKAATQAGE